MPEYVALIHNEPESDSGVSFLHFPGAIAAGTTRYDARAMAEETLVAIDHYAETHGYTRSGPPIQAARRLIEQLQEP